MNDWGDNNTTLWPCIWLVSEKASEGKTHKEQKRQAISYLHYLLLARPDLHIAQGLLASKSNLMFLLRIGGTGVHSFSVRWDGKGLHKLMYAFINYIYNPGDFTDPSYVKMVPNMKEGLVTYNVRITGANGVDGKPVTITNLCHTYVSNPFGTCTHILLNPNTEVLINGEPLAVIKDQLCQVGS